MSENIAEVTDLTFENEVLKSEQPVLVDFWAPWCGPCKAIGPMVEELAEAYAGRFRFFKCNVDDNPNTPANFGIKAIPTLIFFSGGKAVDQITGMVPRTRMEETIEKVLSGEDLGPRFQMQ